MSNTSHPLRQVPRHLDACGRVAPRYDPGTDLKLCIDGRFQARCRHVEANVAHVFKVPHEALRATTRGTANVSLARQVAMYLCHTTLGYTLTEVGRLFDRDRTTVGHACKRIEDKRDNPAFDVVMTCLEQSVQSGEQQSLATSRETQQSVHSTDRQTRLTHHG